MTTALRSRPLPVFVAGLLAALPGFLFLAMAGGLPAGWLTPLFVLAQAAAPAIVSPAWIAVLARRSPRTTVITAVVWGLVCSQAVIYGWIHTN